jgi:uncharacterized protein (UPF0548 family)
VFRPTKPTAAEIDAKIAAAASLPSTAPPLLSFSSDFDPAQHLPRGFVHDDSRSLLGQGEAVFQAAKRAFERWVTFDLGWVRVANPKALIEPGQLVAVEVHTLGLWTLNLSRITEVIDTPTRFGFIYATTAMHVEQGEERFMLEFDPATGDVWYELQAVSRPQSVLARLGLPVTRSFQHKFARDSHRRIRKEIAKQLSIHSTRQDGHDL